MCARLKGTSAEGPARPWGKLKQGIQEPVGNPPPAVPTRRIADRSRPAERKPRFQDLSSKQGHLLRQMQDVNFGRITINVVGGEPDFGNTWRRRQTVKLHGGENGPRPEADNADFELHSQHLALFNQLARIINSTCVDIEVKHGLPFMVEIEQEYMAA